MGSKKGADKYTEEFVLTETRSLLSILKQDADINFIGSLFCHKEYSRQRFSEWADKFKTNTEISDIIKKIEDVLESRAVDGGLKGKLNPTMVIFLLKNKYAWKDSQDINHNLSDNIIDKFAALSNADLLKAINALNSGKNKQP